MSDHKKITDESGGDSARSLAESRAPRTIRFSDSEWKRIDKLAVEQGISSADLVRQTMIAMTGGKLPAWFDATSGALPPGIQTQIEKIYRGVYILATLKRDKMYREGRQNELDAFLEAAKRTQVAIMKSASGS